MVTDQSRLDAIRANLDKARYGPWSAYGPLIANAPADLEWLIGEVERLTEALAVVEDDEMERARESWNPPSPNLDLMGEINKGYTPPKK